MNEFENEEEITLDSSVGDESPTEIGSPEAPTIEEPVGLPSSADQGDDEELDDTPLHEAVGSVLGLSDEPSEGEFEELPDLYEDGELPPTDDEWEALPETPELEEQYEVETEDEELRRLDEDTFSTEDLGPVASESTILHYEVQARTYDEQPWETIAYVNPDDELLEVADLPVGETWSFRIRTVFTNGESSAWSAPSPVVFPEDMLAPGVPSDPVVAGNHAGIGVTWDGLDENGAPMPPDFARVIIWQSPTGEDGTFERRASVPGAMEAILTGYDADEEHYFAFTAMDFAGNESGFSGISSAARTSLVNVKEIEEKLAQLDQTDADLTEAAEELDRVFTEMDDRQEEFDVSIADAVDRIGNAETIIGPLPQDVQQAKDDARESREAAEAAEARAVEANNRAMTRLANGNFEQGLDYWLFDNASTQGVDPNSGSSYVAINADGWIRPQSAFPVIEGQVWELSLHAKAQGGSLYATFGSVVDNVFTPFDEHTITPAIEWSSFGSLRATIPAGVDILSFEVRAGSTGSNRRVDDVTLRDVTDVVRLEAAAKAAADKAELAQEKADSVEQALQSKADRSELPVLEQRLTDAFGVADEAVTQAAAQDAQEKATAAQAAAEAEADRLAKAEAQAAQAAAEANAAQDALAKAEAARDAAIAASSTDATAKSDAAQAAAEAEAARLAGLAEEAAKTAAATDAKAKADAAQAEAIRQAALDATAKADAAKTAAENAAKQYADQQDVIVKGEAAADAQSKADAAIATAQEALDSLEIGSRNLVRNQVEAATPGSDRAAERIATAGRIEIVGNNYSNTYFFAQSYVTDPDFVGGLSERTYTVSFDVRATLAEPDARMGFSFDTRSPVIRSETVHFGDTGGEWQRVSVSRTFPANAPRTQSLWSFSGSRNLTPGDVIEYRNWKLEKGHKATDWTPAPEDLQATIDAAQAKAEEAHANAGTAWSHADAAMTRAGAAETNAIEEAERLADAARAVADEAKAENRIQDTRNDNYDPQHYYTLRHPARIIEFKRTTAIGLTGALGGTYVHMITHISWGDPSGGPIRQEAIDGQNNVWTRVSLNRDDWGPWANKLAEAEAAAKQHADNLPKVLHGTGAPSGTAPNGSIWWRHQGTLSGPVIGQWNRVSGQWRSTPIDSEAIANLDVGKLTAGGAEIAEAVIQKLYADVVAANKAEIEELIAHDLISGNADIVSAAIKSLTVTEKASLVEAYVDELHAKLAIVDHLKAQSAWIDDDLLVDGTIKTRSLENTGDILTDALTARKISGTDIDGSTFTGNTFTGGLFEGAVVQGGTVQTHSAPSRGVKINSSGINGYNSSGSARFTVSATTGDMTSNGGTISGGTVTGGTVQTIATANRGVKMTSTGLRAYNASGRETVSINGSNGNVVLDGGDLKAFDITGSTITGGTLQTVSTANRGVKINNLGLQAWDSSGRLTVRVSGDSSTNVLVGRFQTDWNTQRHVQIGGDSEPTSIFFRQANSTSAHSDPAIYTDASNGHMLIIRGRLPAGQTSMAARVQTRIEGGARLHGNSYVAGALDVTGVCEVEGYLRNPGYAKSTNSSNVWMNSSGTFYRFSSKRSTKVNIENAPLEKAHRLLEIQPRMWLDRTELIDRLGEEEYNALVTDSEEVGPLIDASIVEAKLGALPRKVPGLVAEEVRDAGLDEYATYDTDEEGNEELGAVAYDRMWTLLIPLVREQRDQIETLEEHNESLEARLAALEAKMQ